MTLYLARRLLSALPVMAMVAVIVFAIVRLTPGDPAVLIAGDMASADQLAEIRRVMGLDQPLYLQFLLWVGHLLRGDLGMSLISQVPVSSLIGDRLGPSLALAVGATVLSVVVAVPAGVLAAFRRGSVLDRALMGFSVFGFSVPVFLKGYVLILVFSLGLGLLPVQGYRPPDQGVWGFAERLILPVVALSLSYIALIARIARTSVLDIVGEDFIRTARAKGISESAVLLRHALRNAAVPIATVIGVGMATLISGVVVTESVFNLPGLGRLMVEAVLARDYPVIQGLILLFSFFYIAVNLLIDVAYTFLDPRIRY